MLRYIRTIATIAVLAASSMLMSAIELPVTSLNGRQYYYYDVKQDDTLFTLSKKLGISREKIIENNPGVADGISADTRLFFPADDSIIAAAIQAKKPQAKEVKEVNVAANEQSANQAQATPKAKPSASQKTHSVKNGETLYGISRQYGISYYDIIELNPSARDGIREGDILIVSLDNNEAAVSTEESAPAAEQQNRKVVIETVKSPKADVADAGNSTKSSKKDTANNTKKKKKDKEKRRNDKPATENNVAANNENSAAADNTKSEAIITAPEKDEYNIALMLPFMLSEEKPTRSAEMFTDFYKGFLLAAKELSSEGAKINIKAYDTANSLDTVNVIMSRREMSNVDLIIGPDNEQQFDAIVSAVDESKTFVVNTFATKSDIHLTKSNVIQTNLPREQMYAKAIDAFMRENAKRKPVFITRIEGTADKDEFTTALKERLTANGRPYADIIYDNVLSDTNLAQLSPDTAYVFVPVSGSRNEFIKIASTLRQFKVNANAGEDMAVFGYPEWLMLRGSLGEYLNALDAMIYTRFFEKIDLTKIRVGEDFTATYGKPMIEAVPSQALLGYDTANFVIRALRNNHGDFHAERSDYEGIQTSFILKKENSAGLINNSLLLVKFNADGTTSVSKI